MNADDLYNALAGSAWKLAKDSTLDTDDIKQEMYLICMEVAEGRSTYSSLCGGMHEYIMGRLWGLVRRWPRSLSLEGLTGGISEKRGNTIRHNRPNENGVVLPEFIPAELHAPSVEDVLEQRYLLYEQDAIDIEESRRTRERMKGKTILAIMIHTKQWSFRDAAKFCGVSQKCIQNRIRKSEGIRVTE